MRIIAGTARGRPLKSLRTGLLRPTSDRVRAALFSMLESLDADLSSVLDLYAGTGALGIEALSRGEGTAVFVERDQRLCRVITSNLVEAGFSHRAHVLCMSVAQALERLDGPFTLVLADPPYAEADAVAHLWGKLVPSQSVADGGLLVIERAARHGAEDSKSDDWALLRNRTYGDTAIDIYRRERTVA